jgi:hypothetical protein
MGRKREEEKVTKYNKRRRNSNINDREGRRYVDEKDEKML